MRQNVSLPDRYKPLTASVIAGGFGNVLKCQDTYLDRTVLFKTMHDPAHNAQLLNEITALSNARSRHVVDIYDVIFDGNKNITGIIIEYLDGRDFNTFYQEANTNNGKYIRVLFQIAIALKDLHSAGIVHRDLKLENFKESSSKLVKLFDFGISSNQPNYITTTNRGTLVYAAPELYVQGTKIEPALDIYAFGICAWALATNSLPQALYERPPQTSGSCPSISTVLNTLPAGLISLIDSCLSVNPNLRPLASTLVDELGKYLVFEQHLGVFSLPSNKLHIISSANNNVKLTYTNLGMVEIGYDGFDFVVIQMSGSVYVNNIPILASMKLPHACVLVFGNPTLGAARKWIPFFSSHPEVIL